MNVTVDHGGFSATSNTETEAQIREAIDTPPGGSNGAAPTNGSEPGSAAPVVDGDHASAPDDAAGATGASDSASERARNDKGQFVAKPAEEAPAVTEPAAEAPAPKGDSIQARINRLTWEKHEHARQAQALADENARLKALQASGESAPAVPGVRPKPSEADIGTRYQTYGEYVEDLTDWKVEAREAKRDQERQQHEARSTMAAHEARVAKAREAKADYADVILAGESALAEKGIFSLPNVMVDAIVKSDLGGEIAYYLGAHPEECAQLVLANQHTPLEAAPLMRQLLESRLSAAPAPAQPPAARRSQAQPPIKPVGGSPVATDGPPGDDASAAEHARYWNRKLRVPGTS